MSKKSFTLILIVLISVILGIGYMMFVRQPTPPGEEQPNNPDTGFNPFPRTGSTTNTVKPGTSTSTSTGTTGGNTIRKIPALRQIYATPVGGMGATTTASSTLLRFVDRGTGHIFEASSDSLAIRQLSNTTISRVSESYWSRSANAAILRYVLPESDKVTSFFAQLHPIIPESSPTTVATGTKATTTPKATSTAATPQRYELKGTYLSSNISNIAVSPKRDKIFEIESNDNSSIGYVASFDERTKIQIFDTPLTQVHNEWPEENTLTMTTKGSASSPGYLYFFNIKKGSMTKILGPIRGLSTLTNHDATKVLYAGSDGLSTKATIYNVRDSSTQDVVFRTLPEKCVWSLLNKADLYCAVPTEIPTDDAGYPDAWYQGRTSFFDNIWHVDANTGEANQIASLIGQKQLIDATNLVLDPKENFLYFINKKDLSLWSLDITQ